VAGGIALSVLQSEYVGFGGVAPIMIHRADTGETITISGLGPWPKATRLEVFHEEYGGDIPQGLLRTVVPAAPDAWITALERFGTKTFGEVAAAARRFAAEGFPASEMFSEIVTDYADAYRMWEQSAAIYLPGGRPPKPGEVFVQNDLGRTIQYMIDEERAAIARGGDRVAGLAGAHDAFYKGDIARTMVQYHVENGGWLRMEDLAEFQSEIGRPLTARYAGTEILVCGPWCQGPVLGQTLNMLEGIDLVSMGHNSPGYIHHLTEVLKLAYADRHALFGDPNFVDVPIERLMSADYARERRRNVDAGKAFPGMPPAGLPAGGRGGRGADSNAPRDPGGLDTSYICVVDGEGNAFSATPSDASTGSPVIPGLGFVPSSRGTQSWTDPDAPAVLGPGRRPRLTPSPAIARREGEWIMPFGSPGNDVQPQAMLQVFLNIHVWGMGVQEAMEQPRFATSSYPASSFPHAYSPGLLQVESRIAAETIEKLEALGHVVKPWKPWDLAAGGVCAVLANRSTGTLEGGSDPRRPTAVAGW
jgi:gamma-glutamyltranspeptidase/glutathione hydrolase